MAWQDAYIRLFEPEEIEEDTTQEYYSGERGLFGDLLSSATRGVRNVAQQTGSGLEQIGIENPLDDWAKSATENIDFLKPDISEAMGMESPVVSGLKSIPETLVTSVGSVIGGAAVGGTMGGPVGAGVGAFSNLLLTFGLGTYKEKKDEFLKANPYDEEGAVEYGTKHALSEFGLELASDVTALATFGGSKLISAVGKQGIKSTVRNLLSTPTKDLLKAAGISAATELGTEEATYYIQSSADEDYKMGVGPNAAGFIETGVATMGMSLLFGGLGAHHTIKQQKTLRAALESGDTNLQTKASDIIFKELNESGDSDLAQAWKTYTNSFISNNTKIEINEDFVELANKINNKDVAIEDIANANPDIQKNAVDLVLQKAGIGEEGFIIQNEEIDSLNSELSFQQRIALERNREAIKGTKETRKQREILEGRQLVESKQAEREFNTPSPTLEDPIKTLERTYQENVPWETMTSLGEETYDPTDTDNYKFRRDLLESKREMDALLEEDLRVREDVAAENFEERVKGEVKEANTPNRDQTLKFEINRLMKEVADDSNDLTQEARDKILNEVKSVVTSSATKGDTKLLKYIIKQESERVNIGTGTLGIFLTPQEREELKTAKKNYKQSIKTSKKGKELKAKIDKLETKALNPKIELQDNSTPVAASILKEVNSSISEEKTKIEEPQRFIAGDQDAEEGLRGVIAEPSFEEKLIAKERASNGRVSILNSSTIAEEEDDNKLKPIDTSGNTGLVLQEAAKSTGDKLLIAIVNEDTEGIESELKTRVTNKKKRSEAIQQSFVKLTSVLPREYLLNNTAYLAELLTKAKGVAVEKDIDGVKTTDSVKWNSYDKASGVQEGVHKSSGEKITVLKDRVETNQELKEELKDIKASLNDNTISSEEVQTLSKRAGEITKILSQKSSFSVYKGKTKILDGLPSILEVRKKVEEYFKEDSSPSVVLRKPSEGKPKANDNANYVVTKEGKIKKLLNDFGRRKLDKNKNNIDKTIAEIESEGVWSKQSREAVKVLKEMQSNLSTNLSTQDEEILKVYNSGASLIDYIINNGSKAERLIASIIKNTVSKSKLNSIKIKADSNLDRGKHFNGTITLNNLSTQTALHEMVHALTVREFLSLDKNNPLVKKLNSLMEAYKEYLLANDLITEHQVDILQSIETSEEFRDNVYKMLFKDDTQRKLVYALLNPKEFISMAFSDRDTQYILSKIDIKDTRGIVRKAWDSFLKLIRDLFEIPVGQITALEEVLRTSFRIMELEYEDGLYEVEDASLSESFITREIDKFKQESSNQTVLDKVDSVLKSTTKLVSEVFQSTYEALKSISEPVANLLRKLEFRINRDITDRTNVSTPFVRKFRSLTESKQKELIYLINNYEDESARSMLLSTLKKLGRDKNSKGIDIDFNNIITMLKEIDEETETFGLKKYDTVGFYFPRRVRDYDGLVSYLRNRNYKEKVETLLKDKKYEEIREYLKRNRLLEETEPFISSKDYTGLIKYLEDRSDWGIIDEAIKEAEDKAAANGGVLTDRDRAEIASDMLRTGRRPAAYLKTPSGLKQRSVKVLNADMVKFYYNPVEALGMHIREMTERIEINRMLGITQNKELRKDIIKKVSEIEAAKDKTKLIEELRELENKIPNMQALIDEGIGKILADEVKSRAITEEDQKKVRDLIRARITQVGTNKLFSGIRQLALLGTLTQLSTGLRNITDNVWGMYRYGVINQLGSLLDTASRVKVSWRGRKWYDPSVSVTGKNIKELGLDFEAPLREYSTVSNFIDKAIRASGLMLVDRISKISTMEAALKSMKKLSKEEFITKYKNILDKEGSPEKAYDSIQKDTLNEDVKYLLFSEISDFQPVSLSEMPMKYLVGGNARIAYLLKSYSIKSANNFYRESVKLIKDGAKEKDSNKVKLGMGNLVKLSLLFTLIGAGDDWLIDWLNGKEPDFSDSMVETLLTLAIASKYTMERSKTDGIVSSYAQALLPPTNIIDIPFKDLLKLIEGEPTYKTIKMFPAIGTLYYNRITEDGQRSIIDSYKKVLYEEYRENGFKIPSAEMQEVNKRVREFNTSFKPKEKISTLTSGTFESIRKKELKK